MTATMADLVLGGWLAWLIPLGVIFGVAAWWVVVFFTRVRKR